MDGLIAYVLAKKAISTSMGDIGTNLTYKGSVSSVDDLPSGAQAGDMYGVGTEGLYAWNGSAWGAISRIGVQGPEGPQGPAGIPGTNGTNGADGRDGYIQYTAGTGIGIENNIIYATGALSNITVTASMVIDEDPLTFQLTDEQNAIIINNNNVFVNFDATSLGVGASIFTKSKSNIAHEYVFVNHIAEYSNPSKKASHGTTNVIVYNDQTKIAVYTSLSLANSSSVPSYHEIWTFTLDDDTTVDKEVALWTSDI